MEKNRQLITVTESDVEALERMREEFDPQAVSESIRPMMSQSNLLKRGAADVDPSRLVQIDDKTYVLPEQQGG